MEGIKIVLLCIGAACFYGIVHDQVTARICVEYFTVGHVRIIDSDSPTLLGLIWGVIATWWVGLMLGVPAGLASRVGPWPKLTARDIVPFLAVLLPVMAACALLAGWAGYRDAVSGQVRLPAGLTHILPPAKHPAFIADLWAHQASYASGFFGGLVMIAWLFVRRIRQGPAKSPTHGLEARATEDRLVSRSHNQDL